MNYKNIYDSLIDRARLRQLPLETYVEKHHVVPKCLGGDDSIGNLVLLTPEEHFLCHQLLMKLNPENPRLAYAANMMTICSNGKRVNNKLFGWLRRKLSETQKGIVFSEQRKVNISNALKGKPGPRHSEEVRRKISEKKKGIPKSEEHKQKLSIANLGKKHSVESRMKMSSSRSGKPKSEAHNNAVAQAKTGTKKIEVSPGVFKMLNPREIEYFQSTGTYIKIKK